MSNLKFQPVKGTRDFYPEEMTFRSWLFGKAREVATLFGYQEYDGPILEPLELYTAKSGEELVNQQTFRVIDRGGEKQIVLRPELTPTLARMVAQKQAELLKPIRWFSIGPRWRYEKPQKGRTREFYQWDVDLVGSKSAESDAEILSIAATFLKSVGLTPQEVKIKVNDRSLMESKLALIGIAKDNFGTILKAIDKKEKMEEKEWEAWLKEIGLTDLQLTDLGGILADRDFAEESETLTRIFADLKDLSLEDYVEFDPQIVRGLEYYTGVVFEVKDAKGEFRSILGGGRYDNLVEVVGGQPLSGNGFAMGDVVIVEVLKKYNKIPSFSPTKTKVLVTIFDEQYLRNSILVTKQLRDKGIPTELFPDIQKLDKQLKYANQKGIPYVAILGPDEVSKNEVAIKNMTSGEQAKISLDDLSRGFIKRFNL